MSNRLARLGRGLIPARYRDQDPSVPVGGAAVPTDTSGPAQRTSASTSPARRVRLRTSPSEPPRQAALARRRLVKDIHHELERLPTRVFAPGNVATRNEAIVEGFRQFMSQHPDQVERNDADVLMLARSCAMLLDREDSAWRANVDKIVGLKVGAEVPTGDQFDAVIGVHEECVTDLIRALPFMYPALSQHLDEEGWNDGFHPRHPLRNQTVLRLLGKMKEAAQTKGAHLPPVDQWLGNADEEELLLNSIDQALQDGADATLLGAQLIQLASDTSGLPGRKRDLVNFVESLFVWLDGLESIRQEVGRQSDFINAGQRAGVLLALLRELPTYSSTETQARLLEMLQQQVRTGKVGQQPELLKRLADDLLPMVAHLPTALLSPDHDVQGRAVMVLDTVATKLPTMMHLDLMDGVLDQCSAWSDAPRPNGSSEALPQERRKLKRVAGRAVAAIGTLSGHRLRSPRDQGVALVESGLRKLATFTGAPEDMRHTSVKLVPVCGKMLYGLGLSDSRYETERRTAFECLLAAGLPPGPTPTEFDQYLNPIVGDPANGVLDKFVKTLCEEARNFAIERGWLYPLGAVRVLHQLSVRGKLDGSAELVQQASGAIAQALDNPPSSLVRDPRLRGEMKQLLEMSVALLHECIDVQGGHVSGLKAMLVDHLDPVLELTTDDVLARLLPAVMERVFNLSVDARAKLFRRMDQPVPRLPAQPSREEKDANARAQYLRVAFFAAASRCVPTTRTMIDLIGEHAAKAWKQLNPLNAAEAITRAMDDFANRPQSGQLVTCAAFSKLLDGNDISAAKSIATALACDLLLDEKVVDKMNVRVQRQAKGLVLRALNKLTQEGLNDYASNLLKVDTELPPHAELLRHLLKRATELKSHNLRVLLAKVMNGAYNDENVRRTLLLEMSDAALLLRGQPEGELIKSYQCLARSIDPRRAKAPQPVAPTAAAAIELAQTLGYMNAEVQRHAVNLMTQATLSPDELTKLSAILMPMLPLLDQSVLGKASDLCQRGEFSHTLCNVARRVGDVAMINGKPVIAQGKVVRIGLDHEVILPDGRKSTVLQQLKEQPPHVIGPALEMLARNHLVVIATSRTTPNVEQQLQALWARVPEGRRSRLREQLVLGNRGITAKHIETMGGSADKEPWASLLARYNEPVVPERFVPGSEGAQAWRDQQVEQTRQAMIDRLQELDRTLYDDIS